jgi:hypothetical protein
MDDCVGGGEVALRITGVQKTKKEKAKILPVDRADYRQLISRGGTPHMSFPLCWGGCRPHKPSRYRERRRACCAGGGEVVLRITGVQKKKKEKAKILPVDGADS